MDAAKNLLTSVQEIICKVNRLQKEVIHCRNELCLKCGNYQVRGGCDDCRFRRGGEWSEDLDE